MFTFIYLDKKRKTLDIRLEANIKANNFHEKMDNLGIINIILILLWEFNISYLKIGEVIGEIKFLNNHTNYEIIHITDVDPDDYIELNGKTITLTWENKTISFDHGFLNFKDNKFGTDKAKIRSDIITGGSSMPNKDRHCSIFEALSDERQNVMVLATESQHYKGCYKVFVPDVFNRNELKYQTIIEKEKPLYTLKEKGLYTRSYCLLIYSYTDTIKLKVQNKLTKKDIFVEKDEFKPKAVIYLNGSNGLNKQPNLLQADTEFQTILYNCLPTPKFSTHDLHKTQEYYTKNDNKYRDGKTNNTKALAIDPPGSKDKDDAINFNIVWESNKPQFLEMFVHISDVPPIINKDFNRYQFYYGFHKLETDYMLGCRYPMIDPKLSESKNSISLIGDNKRSYTLKTTYKFKDYETIFDTPHKIEMYLEKNIKIFATTYESVATNTTNYDIDLPLDNDYVVKDRLKFNNTFVPTLNPIPCKNKKVNLDTMFFENKSDINKDDSEYLQIQLNQLPWIYGVLVRSLNIVQDIKPILHTKQYVSNDYSFDLREEWVHRLIEITALESNKYAALLLYDKIKNKTFGINNKTIGSLNYDDIITYTDYFSKTERFIGNVEKDEGIFRGLYYGVKGHNDSPKFVREKYNCSFPASLNDSCDQNNIRDLPNLYLKFQLNKTNNVNSPLAKLLNCASFYQSSENLGVALYSTAVRPHLNAKLYFYTFFTSPMRRIVDCFVQYCLISNETDCMNAIDLFSKRLLNRTDINAQCEKYNLYVSVCNKLFGLDKKGSFTTYYVKYGNESFNNIYFPNIDITMSISQKQNEILPSEGIIKITFNHLTENLEIEQVSNDNKITANDLILEQKKLYFQKERYPEVGTHNYYYVNYKFL